MSELKMKPSPKSVLPEQKFRRARGAIPKPYFHYEVYGLHLASEIELCELNPARAPLNGAPDIVLRLDDVPEQMPSATLRINWLQLDDNRVQVNHSETIRYLVENGREIRVERSAIARHQATANPAELRAYLLGSALGLALHQRGALPLHTSALATPAGVWAFTGPSGAGKSTLAAWLNQSRGWPLLSDDVAALYPASPSPILEFGPPRTKLWQDALDCLGIDSQGLTQDISRQFKFHLPLETPCINGKGDLRALVQLERSGPNSEPTLERLHGADAFKVTLAAVYRPQMGKLIRGSEKMLGDVAALASKLEVYRVCRPWSLDRIEEGLQPLVDQILATSDS